MLRAVSFLLAALVVTGCPRQEPPAETVPALVETVLSAGPAARTEALDRIHDQGRAAAVPLLVEALSDDDPRRVTRAIQALVALGDLRAVPALIELSRPPRQDPALTPVVLRAIGSLGGDEALGYLFTLETGSADPEIRRMAGEIRATVEGRSLPAETAAVDLPEGE